jgi:lysophospholipase L1-like esterase
MKLTLDQIRSIMTGCLTAEEENGVIRFHRMRDPLDAFYRREEGSRIRLECSSGVRLRLVTDSRTLRIGIRFGAAARPFYQGVLLLDGHEQGVFGPAEPATSWEGMILERPARSRSLLDLWLPHLVRADLLFLELDDNAMVESGPAWPGRWLALGDSITQGMTVRKPTDSWFARVALATGLESFNYGIGGAILHEVLAEGDLPPDCDVVSLAYGTNDLKRSTPERYAANLRAVLDRLAQVQPRARVLILTPIPWVGNEGPQESGVRLDDFRKAAAAVAAGHTACRAIPGPELMPEEEHLFVDKVHPNEAGMKTLAEQLVARWV